MITRLLLIIPFLVPILCEATHLKGGYIRVERLSPNGYTYRITLHIFTSAASNVSVGGPNSSLDPGDGTSLSIPSIIPTPVDEFSGQVIYSTEYSYQAPGVYTISFREPNRNMGVINLPGSVQIAFYIETRIVVDDGSPAFATPEFLTTPILLTALGGEYSYGITAVDRQGYTLVFDTGIPRSPSSLADVYTLPENYHVNRYSGLVTWDKLYKGVPTVGEYLFNVRVFQFDGDKMMSFTTLEFTILVLDEPEELALDYTPPLDANHRVVLEAGTTQNLEATFSATGDPTLGLHAYTDIPPSGFSFVSSDSPASSGEVKVGTISLERSSEMIREAPYILTIRGVATVEHSFAKDVSFLVTNGDTDLSEYPDPPDIDNEDKNDGSISVYPNPFGSSLYVKWSSNNHYRITLYNALGQRALHSNGSDVTRLDVGGLSSGIYIYRITDGTATATGKLIKYQ